MVRRKPDAATRAAIAENAAARERWPGVTIEIDDAGGKYYFDADEADRACDFFPTFLKHLAGEFAGEPFELLPWQSDLIIRPLFGWKRSRDSLRRFRTLFLAIPKKNGKALAVDTPIRTPDGWTTMGEVQVGDLVYGPDGVPTRVVAATEVLHDRDCFNVSFSDGTSVVADGEHLWRTRTRKPEGHHDVHTTRRIAETLRVEYSGSAGFNHSIRLHAPLQGERQMLPIPPYALGVWLGDGHSSSSRVTLHENDEDVLKHLTLAGVTVDDGPRKPGTRVRTYLLGRGWMQVYLRNLGVLNQKHIPRAYLLSPVSDRMELLRGLMDTDGTCSRAGQCEFSTTSPDLWRGFLELARSLGLKPTTSVVKARIDGRVVGDAYRVRFYSYADESCFHLSRKSARLKERPAKHPRSRTRHIVACEPVASVPVRCIQVERPDGLFLAGEGMATTHNSALISGIGLYVLHCDDEPGAEVVGAAKDRKQAGIVFNVARDMNEGSAELSARSETYRKSIVIPSTRSSFTVVSRDVGGQHGPNIHALLFDEFHTQPNRDLYDTLAKGTIARRQPLTILITTAGDDDDSICYEEWEYSRHVIQGVRENERYLPVLFEATEEDDWRDPETWRKVNPSIGVTVQEEDFADEVARAEIEPRRQGAFKRLHLNMWTRTTEVWIPIEWWNACPPISPEDQLAARPVAAGIDLSSTTDLTACVLTFRLPSSDAQDIEVEDVEVDPSAPEAAPTKRVLSINYDLALVPYLWMPEDRLHERSKEDGIDYGVWVREGHLRTTPGSVVDYDVIYRTIVDEIAPRYNVKRIGYDPWNATQFALQLEKAGFEMVEVRQGARTLSAPCKVLHALVKAGRVHHNGNAAMTWCVANTSVKEDENENIRPVKTRKKKRIDGVVGAVTALSQLLVLPDRPASPYKYRGVRSV